MLLKARLAAAVLAAAASGPILAAPPANANANGKGLTNRAADVQRGKSLLDRGRGVGRQQSPLDAGGGSLLDRVGSSRAAGGGTSGGTTTATEARASQRLSTREARGHAFGRARLDNETAVPVDDGGVLDGPTGEIPGGPGDELRGRERFALTQAERLLAKRLASIDHLRDIALRNGNTRLLEQCDHLEAIARTQYDRRTAGFDVPSTDPPTDPTAPTDPVSPTDPTTPTDPTSPSDPLDPTLPSDPLDPTLPTDPLEPVDPAPEDPVELLPPELPGDEAGGDVTLEDPIPVDEPVEPNPAS